MDFLACFVQLNGFHMDPGGALLDKSQLFSSASAEIDDSFHQLLVVDVITRKGTAIVH